MDNFEPTQSDWLEINARLSAQRFLIEQLYANAFLGNPEGLDAFMDGVKIAGRERAYTTEPLNPDVEIEMQARVATHLHKFHEAVSASLWQDHDAQNTPTRGHGNQSSA